LWTTRTTSRDAPRPRYNGLRICWGPAEEGCMCECSRTPSRIRAPSMVETAAVAKQPVPSMVETAAVCWVV
jgi:hypothetical protein